jgi:ribosomal protein S18 acetylase RimI-like enzyme
MSVVRRAIPDDWEHFRDLRLAALTDTPDAYGSTLEVEQQYAEDQWREWIQSDAIFLSNSGLIGATQLYESHSRFLYAMWVDPRDRGGALGSLLVEAGINWARTEAVGEVNLYVAENNNRAFRFFEKMAFTRSGVVKPLRDGEQALCHEMRRSI